MKNSRGNRRKTLLQQAFCFCILFLFGMLLNGMDASAAGNTIDRTGDTETTETTEAVLDMANVTLEKTSVTGYLVPTYNYGSSIYYGYADIDIAVNSPVVLDETMDEVSLSCKSSNKNVQASVSLSNNILHLRLNGSKKCSTKLTVTIAGKKFPIQVSLKTVNISNNSLLLVKGKTKKLKIKGCTKGITWSSSDKKIATVSKSGVVKGKKIGNVVITAKIDGKPIGCAVSVTTSQLKKVCERATYIGTHWTYSQAKRTQYGYYDCSALVWKAYMEGAGFAFGNRNYPGTSATEAAWCKANNRILKGGYTYKKAQKMKLNPGDLIFKSTNKHDPYNTTYHVEMFTGYVCFGYDSNGKPNVAALWASRGANYYVENGSLLARPLP